MINRILGWLFPAVRRGATLDARNAWEIEVPIDTERFVRSLPRLVPAESVVVLEGVSTPRDLREALLSRAIEPLLKISPGTLLPTPDFFHLPLTQENADWLADLLRQNVGPEICTHLYVYNGDHLLLAWWDAPDDPICVSKSVPEATLGAFCNVLGTHYNDGSRAA